MQLVDDNRVNRSKHVWREIKGGPHRGCYQCVLCGGVSAAPGDDVDCRVYLGLTEEDRRLCPPADKPKPPGQRPPHETRPHGKFL